MKKITYAIALLLCVGCNGTQQGAETHGSKGGKSKTHEHGHEHAEHNKANKHMHQSSVKDLIERFESPERGAYQKPNKVLDYLGDIQGLTIMDIGAGSGYFSVKLANRGAKVIAADVEDQFLEFIQNRIKTEGLKNIQTRKIPFNSPNLKAKEVDKVLIVNTYHHIENRPDYFKKVKEGTKEKGELVIVDFFKTQVPVGPPSKHKVAMDVVVDELKKAGYTKFTLNVDLLPYQYILKAQ